MYRKESIGGMGAKERERGSEKEREGELSSINSSNTDVIFQWLSMTANPNLSYTNSQIHTL